MHPEVVFRGPDVHDRLVAAGLDVEDVISTSDPVQDVLSGRADIALVGARGLQGPVESLTTLAVLPRQDPRDVVVTLLNRQLSLRTLEAGVRVAVHGARRRGLLGAHRRDLEIIDTPDDESVFPTLDEGGVDAVIVSALEARGAGRGEQVCEVLDLPKSWLPEPGQGAAALVSRHPIAEATALDHLPTRTELRAEIALLEALDLPEAAAVGSLAQASGRWIRLWAVVVSDDGQSLVRSDRTGPLDEPGALGAMVARELTARGASLVLARST